MKHLGDINEIRREILEKIRVLLKKTLLLANKQVASVDDGVGVLQRLRAATYEDLNQIQHEGMVLDALDWLVMNESYTREIEWSWNPRQTGTKEEPDLRGTSGLDILLSAEVTTAAEPKGKIDERMRETLTALAGMPGDRYYFVRTETMYRRALRKVAKGSWAIKVVRLPLREEIDDLA